MEWSWEIKSTTGSYFENIKTLRAGTQGYIARTKEKFNFSEKLVIFCSTFVDYRHLNF